MKIVPTYDILKKDLNITLNFLRKEMGEQTEYDIKTLKKLKEMAEEMLKTIELCKEIKIKKKTLTLSGKYIQNEVSAIQETNLYKYLKTLRWKLEEIVELMEDNKINNVKGFNFTKNEIDTYIEKYLK